jgi:hypothetical protein
MAKKDQVRGPMTSGFPPMRVGGDQRDTIDQNPHVPMTEAPHDRSKDTLPVHFFEGEDMGGDLMGRVVDVTEDILSTPMSGQRRSATGEHESPDSTLGINFKK